MFSFSGDGEDFFSGPVRVNGPVIVGAGPSGLAVGACLRDQGVPFVVLEKADCIASLWQKRTYDRLKLHLPKQFCQLPNLPFPDHFPEYPTKKQFIDYLESYAKKFEINPQFNECVQSATYDETCGLWRVKTVSNAGSAWSEVEYICQWLVVATCENAECVVQEIDGLKEFSCEVIHACDYKSLELRLLIALKEPSRSQSWYRVETMDCSHPQTQTMQELGVEVVDCSKGSQRITVLLSGGNHGLLSSTAFLLMAPNDIKTFSLTWLANTASGACAMAIRKFVSEYSQYDIEMAQIEREVRTREVSAREFEEMKKKLPSPLKTAVASTAAFAVGAFVPLLPTVFIEDHQVRLVVRLGSLSLALLGLGGVTAALRKAPLVKSALRVLAGETLAMAIRFGLNKLVGRFTGQS